MVEVRVERLVAEVASSNESEVRVARAQADVLYNDRTNPIRVARSQVNAFYNDRTHPVRVQRFMLEALTSIATAQVPTIIRQNLAAREANPFRPTLPREVESVSPVLSDYMQEQTAQIREQHNVTQAGDSTVPWEFLTKVSNDRLYTLGSIGRFWHDDFGIIQARYCQFTHMVASDWINSPCGPYRNDSVTWQVTNDFGSSDPARTTGIIASYVMPTEGQYGWVIVDGANIAPLLLGNPDETIGVNDQLVWSATDGVSTKGLGVSIGTAQKASEVVSKAQVQMAIGSVYIKIGAPSKDSLQQQIDATTDPIKQAISHLVPTDTSELTQRVNALELSVQRLQSAVTSNDQTKAIAQVKKDIAAIQTALGGKTLQQIKTEIQLEQQVVDQAQSIDISALQTKVGAIQQTLNALVSLNLSAQINQLTNLVNHLLNQSQLIPLVDGSIPPELVYLPTGELVYLEV